ncbi:uncharacterized protein LOC121725274 [Aricia agestis]|uniref:uncharacterized protein LOC121725274 n=1 Tax=Aricia agestis TaxID=91739 RepID=UPI001C205E71|nr:uncharacterized protein LOC121725274 [Aricia agestis]
MSKCALSETVETLGAWIICRSKTYTNRPYYFNTLTGQAVWNLSKAEIEKARRAERNSLKTNFSVEDCPEPEGSPEYYFPNTMNPNNNRMRNERLRPKVYNKQVINNRFTRTSGYSPMNTIPMGIPVAAALYNPLMWNVPPQQVFLGPYSTSPNVNSQLPVSETSVPLSRRFSSYNDTRNIQPTSYMKTPRSQFAKPFSVEGVSLDSINRIRDNTDLRQKLLARRTSKSIETCQGRDEEAYVPPMQQNEETLLNMKDENWLAKNLQKNPYSIDTHSIKELFNVEDNGFWYIVTDTVVLLSNTNFMRVLLNHDKQCNLILPKAVFEEIEGISKSNLNPPANQALAFISQEIILNQAIIDEETLSDTGLYVQDEILGCCSRLSEQGFPVILLTNNVEILDLKDSVTYQILTMKEFKTQVCRPTESVKKYLPLNDTERNIKITIPNELNETSLKQQTEDAMNDNEIVEPTTISRVVLEKETNNTDVPVPCERENEAQNHAQYNTITNVENDTRLSRRKILNRQRSQDSTKSTCSTTNNFKWRRKSNANGNVDEFNKPEERNIKEISSQPSGSDMKKTKNSEIPCQPDSPDINKTNSPKKVTINDSPRVANEDEDNDVILIKTEPLSPKCNVSKDDKNVMFEITSQSMEDNLKLKCDEWVSRFIQIMEEVLTQVLHREPKFVCDAMPPPWTLYEATECTRKKFHNDGDIVDAANKLRNILFDIGGSRGKVKLNISPMQYMEMYSYGVYLTDALQSAITKCEDLQIAAESLYKLLSDIQDTNADINHDSLCNITNEEIEKVADQDVENNINQSNDKQNIEKSNVKAYQLKEVPDVIVRKKNPQTTKNTTERSPAKSNSSILSNEITSPSKYFLRSTRKSTPQRERTTYTSKWDFLNKLDLTRTSSLEDFEPSLDQEVRDSNTASAGCREPCQDNQRLIQGPILSNQEPSDDNQEHFLDNQGPNTNSQDRLANNQGQCQENDSKSNNFSNSELAQSNENIDNTQSNNVSEEKVMHPKIIRNFVRCIEFEEKIKKNTDFTQDFDFSFNEDFDLQCEVGYYNAFDYDDSQNDDYGYEFDGDYGYDEEEKQFFEEEVNNMNCLIKEVVTETKTVFTLVKNFCEKCCELLSSSTTFDETDTLQEAENASKSLDSICETLDSILKREAGTSKNSIKAVSINPELNCIEMSDEEVNKYREVISKSLEQGKLLKETVIMLIKAIKSKT